MKETDELERIETVVIGGGQAGLAVGYHLVRAGRPFVILDANPRIGDAWRNRWDSLRLFTPVRSDGLPGVRFPGPRNSYPTKDEVADYLAAYASRFELPVRTGTEVERLRRDGDRFLLTGDGLRLEANNVVVAMSSYQQPLVPNVAGQLDPGIVQMHANEYRNPSQLREGSVLVVGAHDTGSDIAMEIATSHRVWLAGRNTGQIPFRIDGAIGRWVGVPLVMFMFHRVLKVTNPIGRKVRKKILHHAGPVIRIKDKDLAAAGIGRVPRVVGVRDGLPLLEDDRVLEVANVLWCTGFAPEFAWIENTVVQHEAIDLLQDRGLVPSVPGLYFVGLSFLGAASSSLLRGVGRDAKRIAGAIDARAGRVEPPASRSRQRDSDGKLGLPDDVDRGHVEDGYEIEVPSAHVPLEAPDTTEGFRAPVAQLDCQPLKPEWSEAAQTAAGSPWDVWRRLGFGDAPLLLCSATLAANSLSPSTTRSARELTAGRRTRRSLSQQAIGLVWSGAT